MTMHATSQPHPALPLVGETIEGRFELRAVMGEGGMGHVYRAYDHQGAREVALKLLTPRYLGRPEREQRFLREAELGRRARHAHLAEYLDAGRLSYLEWPFVSMEIIEGRDLGSRLVLGALPPKLAVRIARQLAGAVRALHRAGVVHRDVTPMNVLMRGDDDIVLIDLSHAGDTSGPLRPLGDPGRLTQPHEVPGTHHYMPREQAQAAPAHPAMDVYAFGVTLVHMLTGRAPWGYDRQAFIAMQREGKVVPPRVDVRIHSAVPPELAELAHACTRANADQRPTMDEIVQQLDEMGARLLTPQAEPADGPSTGVEERRARAPHGIHQPRRSRPLASPSPSRASADDQKTAAARVEPHRGDEHQATPPRRRWVPLTLFVAVLLTVGGWAMWPRSEVVEGSPTPARARQDSPGISPVPARSQGGALTEPTSPLHDPVMAASGDDTEGEEPSDAGEPDERSEPAPDAEERSKRKAKVPSKRKPQPEQRPAAAPAPSATDDCAKARERAADAVASYDWPMVARLASKSQCWDDHTARRRLLVEALFRQNKWAECVRAGGNSKDATVNRWVDFCKRNAG